MTSNGQTTNQLPSLPQVLVHILEVMQGDEISFSQLAERIRHDSAISARLMSIATSSPMATTARAPNIERALLVLGFDTIKTVVITTAIRQFFNGFARDHQNFLKAFWRRSLMTAIGAQKLAYLTGYHAPDQAYLAGLLSDIGQLLLLQQHDQTYLNRCQALTNDHELLQEELDHFDRSHPETGAALVAGWQIDPAMIDAILRHHDDGRSLVDALQLVKIINLANRLSAPNFSSPGIDILFGFNENLLLDLRQQNMQEAKTLAQTLEIDTGNDWHTDSEHAHTLLGQRIGQLSELEQARAVLKQARDEQDLQQVIQRVAHIMLDAERSHIFLINHENQELEVRTLATWPSALTRSLPLELGHSIVSDAFLKGCNIDSSGRTVLTSFDRSLLRSCLSQRLVCIPLKKRGQSQGVLVLGLNAPLPIASDALSALCTEIAAALFETETNSSDSDLHLRIEEAIHEAGNPLSIIGNYLEMLRLKLGDEHQATEDIHLIRQEIDRVGNILLQLKEPTAPKFASTLLDLNALIEQLAKIFERSIFTAHSLKLELRLNPELPLINADASLIKQIVINLVKNAAEALDESGTVIISSDTIETLKNENPAIALTIEDDGPGIPELVMKNLFSPKVSSKGQAHAGLGLSVTKRLVEELGGEIDCHSGTWGSRFQILIPLL